MSHRFESAVIVCAIVVSVVSGRSAVADGQFSGDALRARGPGAVEVQQNALIEQMNESFGAARYAEAREIANEVIDADPTTALANVARVSIIHTWVRADNPDGAVVALKAMQAKAQQDVSLADPMLAVARELVVSVDSERGYAMVRDLIKTYPKAGAAASA